MIALFFCSFLVGFFKFYVDTLPQLMADDAW
jgi:hypothetical protein